jgi:hypothetical protein
MSDIPVTTNQQPAEPTLTPAEQALATTIVHRILAALLASPTTGQYILWAVRWGLALAGAKVAAVTDNQVAQVAGWIVTAAMLYLSWKTKRVHVRQAAALSQPGEPAQGAKTPAPSGAADAQAANLLPSAPEVKQP